MLILASIEAAVTTTRRRRPHTVGQTNVPIPLATPAWVADGQ
jgi:hypothetical protein